MSSNKNVKGQEKKTKRRDENDTAWYAKTVAFLKVWIRKLLTFVVKAWQGAQKETRHFMKIVSAAGVLLLLTVVILLIRLHGVREELETVQAMSASLQLELETVQRSAESGESQTGDRVSPSVTVPPTVTGTPTMIPTPTLTPEVAVKKHVVCVDAGHGDWDGGAVLRDENGSEMRLEKEDNLWMAQNFREALEAYGVEVIMTRETDEFLELSERTGIANAANVEVLLSFHRNSYNAEGEVSENEIGGTEIWVHNSKPVEAVNLATELLNALTEVGGMKNRGVKYGTMTGNNENYAINREADMTSMIIELGFITNPADNDAYDAYGQAYAEAMAEVVYEWLEAQEQ